MEATSFVLAGGAARDRAVIAYWYVLLRVTRYRVDICDLWMRKVSLTN